MLSLVKTFLICGQCVFPYLLRVDVYIMPSISTRPPCCRQTCSSTSARCRTRRDLLNREKCPNRPIGIVIRQWSHVIPRDRESFDPLQLHHRQEALTTHLSPNFSQFQRVRSRSQTRSVSTNSTNSPAVLICTAVKITQFSPRRCSRKKKAPLSSR